MAALDDKESQPERKITSNWSELCDSEAPNTTISHQDTTGRELPENAFILHDLFSESECIALIEAAETAAGFGSTTYRKEYRGNLRLITTDQSLTDVVFERLKGFMPNRVTIEGEEWELSGMNECWRLSKYYPGDRFGCHYDASFARSSDVQSIFTINTYMNGDFTGGHTRFYDKLRNGKEVAAIKGTPGQCLIFMQPPGALLAHDGEALGDGLKYLFRSDVMYTKLPPTYAECDHPNGLAMIKQAQELELGGLVQESREIYARVIAFYPAVAEKFKLS